MHTFFPAFTQVYSRILKAIVISLAFLAGASVLIMMLLPCLDIILRQIKRPIPGVYDWVQVTMVLAISFGLPYTTAVKGHIAVELFYHKLTGMARLAVELLIQTICIVLFAALAVISVQYGNSLLKNGVVMSTSQVPLFWLAYIIAFNSFVMVFVFINIFLHSGKEVIKP
jgi:TRAP-type C4-dicarboxylate transport system permease small subunit